MNLEATNREDDIDLLRGCPTDVDEIWTSQVEDSGQDLEMWLEGHERTDRARPEANWCGLCCLRSILKAHQSDDFGIDLPSLDQMFRDAVQAGVYKLEENGKYSGAYHQPLARFIEDRFRLPAQAVEGLSRAKIRREIDAGKFVIASVHPSLRYPQSPHPEKPAGHFVLIHGYYGEDRWNFRILDSTGVISQGTHINSALALSRFRHFFSGRAVLVRSLLPMNFDHSVDW